MPKSRGLFFIGLFALLAVVAVLLLGRGGKLSLRSQANNLPLDLQNILPPEWAPLTDQAAQCDFDRDGEREWLVFYRYDQTQVALPYRKKGSVVSRGPIGAVIYDTQTALPQTDVGTPGPYLPTYLIPYRLLPDFYLSKGQGYLGETKVEPIYYPPIKNQKCEPEELSILGYSDGALPTRLSVFRWQDAAQGYAGYHFVGDARIETDIPADGTQPARQVTTYNHLENHRSLLCVVRSFTRSGAALEFTENRDAYTVDFCYGAPSDPAYPEGAVVAMLRNVRPAPRGKDLPTPPTAGYLTADFAPVFGLSLQTDAARPVPILSVANFGNVTAVLNGGNRCTEAQLGEGRGAWWCGRETAVVETEIPLAGIYRRIAWHLISVTRMDVNADVYWRVARAEILP